MKKLHGNHRHLRWGFIRKFIGRLKRYQGRIKITLQNNQLAQRVQNLNPYSVAKMITFLVFVLAFLLYIQKEGWVLELNALGDFIAGFGTSLALVWIVATSSMQKEELELQRQEMQHSNKIQSQNSQILYYEFVNREADAWREIISTWMDNDYGDGKVRDFFYEIDLSSLFLNVLNYTAAEVRLSSVAQRDPSKPFLLDVRRPTMRPDSFIGKFSEIEDDSYYTLRGERFNPPQLVKCDFEVLMGKVCLVIHGMAVGEKHPASILVLLSHDIAWRAMSFWDLPRLELPRYSEAGLTADVMRFTLQRFDDSEKLKLCYFFAAHNSSVVEEFTSGLIDKMKEIEWFKEHYEAKFSDILY